MVDSDAALEILLKLTRALARAPSLEAALKLVTNAGLALFDCDHTSIRVLDHAGTELVAGARSGVGTDHRPVTFGRGLGVGGWVVEKGQIARIDDADDDPRFVKFDGQGFRIGSMLAIPLWAAGGVIGYLSLSSSKKHAFDDRDEDLATLLANCAVPPIESSRLERLQITDVSTRTFNQRYIVPRLTREMELAKRNVSQLSVVLLGLDDLDDLNRAHGYEAVEKLLRAVAAGIKGLVRGEDVIIRRGGAGFLVLMPSTALEEAKGAAERIQQGLRRPLDVSGIHVLQTLSIGVATWDGHESVAELERRVEDAMLGARDQGGDRIVAARV